MSDTDWCEACNQEHRNGLCPETRPVQPDIEALKERAINTRNDIEAALFGPGGYDSDEWLGAITALLTSLEKEIDNAQQATITSLQKQVAWLRREGRKMADWLERLQEKYDPGDTEEGVQEVSRIRAALGEGE